MTIRMHLLWTAALLMLWMDSSAWADDFAPPAWRGGRLSTTQGWDFLTFQDPYQPDDPNVPLVIGNGGGVPTLSYASMGWIPLDGDGGLISGGTGSFLELYIPNWIDFRPYKQMWIQITFVGNPNNVPYITNMAGRDNLASYVYVVPDPPVLFPIDPFNGVNGLGLGYTLYPNPDWEVFDIVVPEGVVIDQIVVDTISIPEPASVALLGFGGLALGAFARRRRTRVRRCSPSLMVSCLVLGILASAAASHAQTWTEIGDAGDLIATHQDTVGTGPLTTITGTLSGGPVDWADVYCIRITDRTTFTATVSGAFDDGIPLWLFDSNGNGITSQEGFYLSTPTMITGAFVPSSPGIYFLAISPHDTLPYSATGDIWSGAPRSTETGPNGTGAPGPLLNWNSFGSAFGGAYSINLTGAEYGNCVPEPATLALAMIGVVGSLFAHRRAPVQTLPFLSRRPWCCWPWPRSPGV